jgi:hypothetical protein
MMPSFCAFSISCARADTIFHARFRSRSAMVMLMSVEHVDCDHRCATPSPTGRAHDVAGAIERSVDKYPPVCCMAPTVPVGLV